MSRAALLRVMASGPLTTDAWLVARAEQLARATREDCYAYRHPNGVAVITQGPDLDHPKQTPLHVARYVKP